MNKQHIIATLGLAVSSALLPVSAEVIPGTTLSINFESSHMVGSGRHLNIMRVPVTDIDSGDTTLFDVSFKFSFDPTDGFTFGKIVSAAVSPPITSIANIIPGTYQDINRVCYIIEGPSQLSATRSLYTIRSNVEPEGCYSGGDTFRAQFISGLATGHPDIGNREIVPNLSESYVYGVIATDGKWTDGGITRSWEANEMIGIRQSGDQLIIGLFSEGEDNNGVPNDFSDPRATAILTKIVE